MQLKMAYVHLKSINISRKFIIQIMEALFSKKLCISDSFHLIFQKKNFKFNIE